MNILDEARKVLRVEGEALLELSKNIDTEFERAVQLIHESMGRVIVTGMGKSGLVGKKIAATLASTGTPAFFLHPAEASHGDLGMVTPNDIILSLSNSGETEELVALIPYIKRFGVKLISFVGSRDSNLGRASDVCIEIAIGQEACPMGLVPTASTTAALAAGDALAVALLLQKGFKSEDFAAFHPKGSLGKKLLTRVRDLMHTGQDIPMVGPGTSMAQAVVVISSKRLGIAVVHEGGKAIGIITDGDLRRGIEKWGQDLFKKNTQEVMTASPKSIKPDELAAKALSTMQDHSITSIVVTDEDNKAVGIIHIHDILKHGIV